MLYNLIASSTAGERILEWIEYAAVVIEVLAVVIIVMAIFLAVGHYVIRALLRPDHTMLFRELRIRLGRALLLGLEILVAADIIRTVALEATLQSVAVLGLLVLIRTFLSWALVVEIEGRWPWQPEREESQGEPMRTSAAKTPSVADLTTCDGDRRHPPGLHRAGHGHLAGGRAGADRPGQCVAGPQRLPPDDPRSPGLRVSRRLSRRTTTTHEAWVILRCGTILV